MSLQDHAISAFIGAASGAIAVSLPATIAGSTLAANGAAGATGVCGVIAGCAITNNFKIGSYVAGSFTSAVAILAVTGPLMSGPMIVGTAQQGATTPEKTYTLALQNAGCPKGNPATFQGRTIALPEGCTFK